MPQVPYVPVPQQSVDATPLSGVNVNTPEAAFGGDVARAISGLGKTAEGAGDQIYERAVWYQNLNNQAEARKADATYIIESGKLQAKFNSLEGDQVAKAYPKHIEDLKALRGQIRSGLTTRASQDMYDGQTLGTLSRTIFNGANHSAAAQKKFVVDSMEAQRTAITQSVAAEPTDGNVAQATRRIEQSVRQEGALRGQPPEAIENNVKTYNSAIYATKIETLAKEYPLQGPTELTRLRSKLTIQDFKRVENVVNNQRDAYGSAKIASDLIAAHTDEDGDLRIPMSELQAKARALATQFSPDDPAFAHKTVRQLDSEFNQRKYARKQENYDNRDILAGAIQEGISNMDQLLANPKTAASYYALPKAEQLKVPGRIDDYIKARDRQFNDRTMTTIMGLRNNDVTAFLETEPTDEKYRLSQAQIRQVQQAQAKIKNQGAAHDPRVPRAMGWMRSGFGAQMEAMGVYSRTNRNKEDYDHLTGAVQQALDIWQEDKKKPPTNKEFNEQIAPEILKQTKVPGMLGIYGYGVFGSDQTVFRHDTSSKEYKSFYSDTKSRIQERGGNEPSDEEIYKAYTRTQLLKLYPPKGKAKPNE